MPGVVQLSLQDAIARGLKQNLGVLLAGQDVRSSRGARWQALSALLPNVNTSSYVADSKVDLAEFGFSFKFPLTIPRLSGLSPISIRAPMSRSPSLTGKRSTARTRVRGSVKSAQYTYKDARDLVILAVGFAYLAGDRRRSAHRNGRRSGEDGAGAIRSGVGSGQSGHFARDRRPSRASGTEDPPAAVDSGEKRFRHSEADCCARDRLGSRAAIRAYRQIALPALRGFTVDDALKRAYASRSDYQAARRTCARPNIRARPPKPNICPRFP